MELAFRVQLGSQTSEPVELVQLGGGLTVTVVLAVRDDPPVFEQEILKVLFALEVLVMVIDLV